MVRPRRWGHIISSEVCWEYWGGLPEEPYATSSAMRAANSKNDGSDAVADALRRKRRRTRGGTPSRPDATKQIGAVGPPRLPASRGRAMSMRCAQNLSRQAFADAARFRKVVAKGDVVATRLKRRPQRPTAETAAIYSVADHDFRVYQAAVADTETAVAAAAAACAKLATLVAKAEATAETAAAAIGSAELCFPAPDFD